jgi:hypothetical protein
MRSRYHVKKAQNHFQGTALFTLFLSGLHLENTALPRALNRRMVGCRNAF